MDADDSRRVDVAAEARMLIAGFVWRRARCQWERANDKGEVVETVTAEGVAAYLATRELRPFHRISDLPAPGAGGKSYRQVNAERQHAIPLRTLVEINAGAGEDSNGVRLFVVGHARDCDETPLYVLAIRPDAAVWDRPGFFARDVSPGWAEEDLRVVRAPANDSGATG